MRGRHSAAILRMLGAGDHRRDGRRGRDCHAPRQGRTSAAISSQMAENRHKLYLDRAPVAAFEDLFEKSVRG